ncbi:hypothetical protein AVEN_217934-1 [Araneus ventricosus]|uniref:Uncharacterized protein n=1 Tax=Araneus ventricosus TaxID=182803 RepID=A0A4Y2E490_ARAVE|nr:hypothetical protein AVEN_217934-1 [Araneus ventricosus]
MKHDSVFFVPNRDTKGRVDRQTNKHILSVNCEMTYTQNATADVVKPDESSLKEYQDAMVWTGAKRGYLRTDLAILNRGRIARTTLELATPLQTSAPHQREGVWPHTYDLTCNRPTTRLIFSGIGFRTWSPPAPRPTV